MGEQHLDEHTEEAIASTQTSLVQLPVSRLWEPEGAGRKAYTDQASLCFPPGWDQLPCTRKATCALDTQCEGSRYPMKTQQQGHGERVLPCLAVTSPAGPCPPRSTGCRVKTCKPPCLPDGNPLYQCWACSPARLHSPRWQAPFPLQLWSARGDLQFLSVTVAFGCYFQAGAWVPGSAGAPEAGATAA